MTSSFTYPGVYVDEFAPPPPIRGIGTSTAAFVGLASRGQIGEPIRVTSFDRFKELYGDAPVPGSHLWYAVRAYFANGGTICYVVRASNGRAAQWDLQDGSGNAVVRLTARAAGVGGGMQVEVQDASLLPATALYRPSATLDAASVGDRAITVQAAGATSAEQVAAQFRPGDVLEVAALPGRFVVVGMTGATLRLSLPLSAAVAAGDPLGLNTLGVSDTTFRLAPVARLPQGVLGRGSIVTISQGATVATQVVRSVSAEMLPGNAVTYRVTLRSPIGATFDLALGAAAITAQSREHTLILSGGGTNTTYANLGMDPAHPRNLLATLEADRNGPIRASLMEPPPPAVLPNSLLAAAGAVAPTRAGVDEDLTGLTTQNFIDAIDTLRPIDDVNMLAVPDRPTAAANPMLVVQQAMITHCELSGDRFAILDSDPGLEPFGGTGVETQRAGLDSARGFAGLYYPWLRQRAEGGGPSRLTPPSGHMAGIFARADQETGVHKSPANYTVRDSIAVERRLTDVQQGQLNIQGINVIRVFREAGRPVIWGARTTSPDTNWTYVAVRRLMLFLEESIQEGIRYAIFDVHTTGLRKRLKRSIEDFLESQWRNGALFGKKREDAFRVRIDDELNPFSDMQQGILRCEVGLQPAYPVEFIHLRIGIAEGGVTLEEV